MSGGQFFRIYFYYNPGRFHPIYALLLAQTKLADRVKRITHLWEIRKSHNIETILIFADCFTSLEELPLFSSVV